MSIISNINPSEGLSSVNALLPLTGAAFWPEKGRWNIAIDQNKKSYCVRKVGTDEVGESVQNTLDKLAALIDAKQFNDADFQGTEQERPGAKQQRLRHCAELTYCRFQAQLGISGRLYNWVVAWFVETEASQISRVYQSILAKTQSLSETPPSLISRLARLFCGCFCSAAR